MKQTIYVMQFRGQAAPVEGSPGTLKAETRAPAVTVTTKLAPGGVESSLQPSPGAEAEFESEVRFTGGTAFTESGTIAFGNGNRLRFSTVGQGHLAPSPEAGVQHGSVIWQVDEGEGALKNAKGLITSNFTVSETGEVTDNHFGVLYVE